jgi:hypothetical protein
MQTKFENRVAPSFSFGATVESRSGDLRPDGILRRGTRRFFLSLAFCVTGATTLTTAFGLEPVIVRSRSGQFTVRGLPLDASWSRHSTGGVDYLRLDPSLAAVALERIRQATLSELGLNDSWRRPVRVNTFPVQDLDPGMVLTSVRFNDGWAYRLDLPEVANKHHLVEIGLKLSFWVPAATPEARGGHASQWLLKGLSAELRAASLNTDVDSWSAAIAATIRCEPRAKP